MIHSRYVIKNKTQIYSIYLQKAVKVDYTDENKKEVIKALKDIYYSLPKDENELYAYPMNWGVLIEFNIIDIVINKVSHCYYSVKT